MPRLTAIQETDSLIAAEDKRFANQRLLYFFYGRPSYRVHPQVSNTRISTFAPVCFVFKKNFPWPGERLHPFDTGAFIDGRMVTSMHPSFKLGDFELTPVPESAQALVSAFYESNENYIDCEPSNNIDAAELARRRLQRVETYHNLINFAPNDHNDERIHSIELQTSDNVPLKGHLLALVVPGRFFDDEQMLAITNNWECRVIPYHVKDLLYPS